MHTSSKTTYYPRPRSPRLSLAIWGLSLLIWLISLITGTPAKGAEATITPSDLYWVVVDRSGSMGPGANNNNLVGPATEKLREFIASLDPNASLRIVFFSSEVGSIGRWTNLTPATKAAIETWINTEFRPAGYTRLFDTVGHVLAEILQERQTHGRIGLLVFSDGEDNRSTVFKGWNEIERLSDELVAQHPAAFMRLYSLGKEPRSKPAAPWVVQEAPTAADLRKVVLEPAPEARFKIVPETVEVGQKVTLVALPGADRIESFVWNLGDGTSSQDAAVDHLYTTDGVFSGSLTVTGPGGTATKPFAVTVNKPMPLTPEFSWLPKAVRIGETLELIDESSGGPTSWRWFINDQPLSQGSRASWRATEAGNLVVRLEIGRGKETRHVEHVVPVLPAKLDASFTVAPGHSLELGAEVVLRAKAINDGAKHEWHIAGAKIGDAPELRWTPPSTGLAEIIHRVMRGDEVAEAVDRVQVSAQPPPAEFTITPGLEVDLGQEVTLAARVAEAGWRHTFTLSTGEALGGSSVTLPTKHLGRVEIIHAAESPSGRSEARETLIVRDVVTAEFSVQADSQRSPAKVEFTPRSRAGIVAREWVFGDGQSSIEESPVHTYTAPGEYRPTLKIRDVAGREHTWQLPNPITIAPPRAWWLPWSIATGAVLALAAAIAVVIWDRQRLLDLDGRLEWQFGGSRGRVELAGRQFDLGTLSIPNWKPASTYSLIRRKAAGHQLLRDGAAEQAVEEDISLEAEGVRLRLVP